MARRYIVLILITLGTLFFITNTVVLADSDAILMAVGDSKIIKVDGFTRVATSNPDVVEVVVTSAREVLMNAKKSGLAVVNIWGGGGITTYRISVSEDYSNIEREIARLINNPQVQVRVNNKYVVLNGSVATTLDADQAVQYGKMYRDNVINNLNVKTKYQVLLGILVSEVKKDSQKNYGFSWGHFAGTSDGWTYDDWNWMIWDSGSKLSQTSFTKLGAVLEAMQKNGDAKILAAPSILTLSGKEATFLAGGEIPIPVTDGDSVKVEWKEYGIKLKVTPVIGKENDVVLAVAPEVTDLDWANAVTVNGDSLPAVTTRKASTNVNCNSGSTLVIGGLLKREDSGTVYKLPILGDLPIIGSLFRSKEFQEGRTELLFFVTPLIIKNGEKIDTKQITEPEFQGPHYDNKKNK